MIIVRLIIGGMKTLIVLGILEYIAPGLSHEIANQVTRIIVSMIETEG